MGSQAVGYLGPGTVWLGCFKAGLDISPVVTHTISMDDFAQGFDLVNSGQCGKVVMLP